MREETAEYLLLYQRGVMMPLVVLYAIPTIFDVGADGVAWRWRRGEAKTLATQIVDPDLRAVLEAIAGEAAVSELERLVDRVTRAEETARAP